MLDFLYPSLGAFAYLFLGIIFYLGFIILSVLLWFFKEVPVKPKIILTAFSVIISLCFASVWGDRKNGIFQHESNNQVNTFRIFQTGDGVAEFNRQLADAQKKSIASTQPDGYLIDGQLVPKERLETTTGQVIEEVKEKPSDSVLNQLDDLGQAIKNNFKGKS